MENRNLFYKEFFSSKSYPKPLNYKKIYNFFSFGEKRLLFRWQNYFDLRFKNKEQKQKIQMIHLLKLDKKSKNLKDSKNFS